MPESATDGDGDTLTEAARRAAAGDLRDAREHMDELLERLHAAYPDAECSLTHDDPWQLLVATILSAQCTDERVNMVTPKFFERWPGPADAADAHLRSIQSVIRSTGFFRNKAENIREAARAVVADHDGEVPDTMDDLVALPGVGRKTANVVLGNAFDVNVGVVVDTHVGRISRRLGLTEHKDPVKVERDLMELVPREEWTVWSHLLIHHGRAVCQSRKPRCGECTLADLCAWEDKDL